MLPSVHQFYIIATGLPSDKLQSYLVLFEYQNTYLFYFTVLKLIKCYFNFREIILTIRDSQWCRVKSPHANAGNAGSIPG